MLLCKRNYLTQVACRVTITQPLLPSTMSFSAIRSFTFISLAAVALATPLSTSPDGAVYRNDRPFPIAPLHHPGVPAHRVINDSYIIMFKDGVHPAVFENHFNFLEEAHGDSPLDRIEGGLTHVWDAHIKGYAGYFSRDTIERIRRQPEVEYVEHDQMVYALETQKSAPWVCCLYFSVLIFRLGLTAILKGACANQS